MKRAAGLLLCLPLALAFAASSSPADADRAEVEALAARWVKAVHRRDPSFAQWMSREALADVTGLRELALRGMVPGMRKASW